MDLGVSIIVAFLFLGMSIVAGLVLYAVLSKRD